MSAGTQLSMNPRLLLSRSYQLSGNGQFEMLLVGGGDVLTIDPATSKCSVDYSREGGMDGIRVNRNAGKRYQFLPYRPNKCTRVKLDRGSELFLTGPLSGCNVYVGVSGDDVGVCHVNRNSELNPLANLAWKRTAALGALGEWGLVGGGFAGVLEASHYVGYLGFVVGCKPHKGISLSRRSWTASSGATEWTFYIYGMNANGRILKRLTNNDPVTV